MLRAILPLLVALVASCTTYKEFDPVTGQKVIDFSTNANIGITTSKIAESNSATQGIPLLGGGYRNDILTEADENQMGLASLEVGQMKMTGTVDHSTTADVTGGWVWRTFRSALTGWVFGEGIGAYRDVQLADEVTERTVKEISATETIELGKQQSEVASEQIASETAVELAP